MSLTNIISAFYLSMGMVLLNSIPWSIIFLITKSFGIRYYILHNKDIYIRIQKRIGKSCSHLTDNDKGYGYSIGYWYALSLECSNSDTSSYKIHIIATENSYNELIKDNEEIQINCNKLDGLSSKENTQITIFERCGSYFNIWFKKRKLRINDLNPRINQDIIMNEIIDHQKNNKHTVVLLHGKAGSGKSTIGLLLATQLKGSYCNTVKPWEPGDNWTCLYVEAEPSEDTPLIIELEEIDTAIEKIHNYIPLHKNLPILTADKAGWCNLLDSINRGLYPNLILLLTCNKSDKYINEIDEAYIRKGRVDLIYSLEK